MYSSFVLSKRFCITLTWRFPASLAVYNTPPVWQAGARTGTDNKTSAHAKPNAMGIDLVGNLGVAPLPGSSRVYDREERGIRGCSPSVCPLATQDVVVTYSKVAPSVPANQTAASDNSQSSVLGDNKGGSRSSNPAVDGQKDVWVNRAPYSVFIAGITTLCNPTLDSRGKETRGALGLV